MASATTPNTVEWSDEFLPVAPPPITCKMKHLGMMGTPVWCLPWALRCLSQCRHWYAKGEAELWQGKMTIPGNEASAAGEVYDQCQVMGGH
ncbi:hypothetical protein TIFTF001_039409 [Ficus carica]|uniref:Uncharacterized protein n=1 Tax=Ficus carica TaxID=3494 RepID=A0AA88E9R8_FICCA|nr:hypothetical protein TIFTF001_039409 [Ficus carica]